MFVSCVYNNKQTSLCKREGMYQENTQEKSTERNCNILQELSMYSQQPIFVNKVLQEKNPPSLVYSLWLLLHNSSVEKL